MGIEIPYEALRRREDVRDAHRHRLLPDTGAYTRLLPTARLSLAGARDAVNANGDLVLVGRKRAANQKGIELVAREDKFSRVRRQRVELVGERFGRCDSLPPDRSL